MATAFSMITAVRGSRRTPRCVSMPRRTLAYMPGFSAPSGLGRTDSISMVLLGFSSTPERRVSWLAYGFAPAASARTLTGWPGAARPASLSGRAACTRTVAKSVSTKRAAGPAPPPVAAGTKAPTSTERRLMTPAKGARIRAKPRSVALRSCAALATASLAAAASTCWRGTRSGACLAASCRRRCSSSARASSARVRASSAMSSGTSSSASTWPAATRSPMSARSALT